MIEETIEFVMMYNVNTTFEESTNAIIESGITAIITLFIVLSF